MQLRPVVHSRIYRDFLAIEPKDYHGIIRYYEEHEEAVENLETEEFTEIQLVFTHALFEVGAYRQFLAVVDRAILITLDYDYPLAAKRQQSEEFEQLLFRKAAAYLQTLQPAEAEHVICELLRINPEQEMAVLLLRKSLRQQDKVINRRTRAVSILLFGISALIILFEVLFVRSFYHQYTASVELSRNLIFLFGLLILGGGEALTFWRAYRRSQAIMRR
ncbi:MAG: hypothetical protein AAFN81_13795 [Bacteroidota bacterium]